MSKLEEYIITIGIDPNDCKKYINRYLTCISDGPNYIPRKILNAFWSTPNGYPTICYKVEGLDSPIIQAQVFEIK